MSKGINAVVDKIPFSLGEILLYALCITLAVYLVVQIIRFFTRPYRFCRAMALLLNLGLIASIGYFLFMALWGLNYHGPTLAEKLSLDTAPRSSEELTELCSSLIEECVPLREEVTQTSDGVFAYSSSKQGILRGSAALYAGLADEYPLFGKSYGSPKQVLFSKGLSYCQITGVFCPLTMEPNVNMDTPSLYFAATAAHETAHLYGVAREDEANFVAYLACSSSADAQIRYSGSMLALSYSMSQLHEADENSYNTLRARYSPGMERDLQDYADYWKAFDGPVADKATDVNNAYLKSNNQTDGVKSYGRMVDLLLAYHFRTN